MKDVVIKALDVFKIVGVAVALSVVIAYASTWVGPTAPPPGDNISAPINVGIDEQEKTGKLVLNDLQIKGGAPREGMVLMAIDNDGTVGWGNLRGCTEELVYDSLVNSPTNTTGNMSQPGFTAYTLPAKCKDGIPQMPVDDASNDQGCYIRREAYDGNTLRHINTFRFIQYPDGSWWSSYAGMKTGYFQNGNDGYWINIIPLYEYEVGLGIDSDAEKNIDQVSFQDKRSSYSQKVYICY